VVCVSHCSTVWPSLTQLIRGNSNLKSKNRRKKEGEPQYESDANFKEKRYIKKRRKRGRRRGREGGPLARSVAEFEFLGVATVDLNGKCSERPEVRQEGHPRIFSDKLTCFRSDEKFTTHVFQSPIHVWMRITLARLTTGQRKFRKWIFKVDTKATKWFLLTRLFYAFLKWKANFHRGKLS